MTEREEKRYRALHRALWKWMSKHPSADKKDWPGWENRDEIHTRAWNRNYCFACVFDDLLRGCCDKCPIVEKARMCSREGSLYKKFLCCEDKEQRAALCLQMAEAWPPVGENHN